MSQHWPNLARKRFARKIFRFVRLDGKYVMQLPASDKKAPALRMEPPRIMAAKRVLEHVAR